MYVKDGLQEFGINGCWKSCGDESLTDSRIGVTRFALHNRNQPKGYLWVQGRLAKKRSHNRTKIRMRT